MSPQFVRHTKTGRKVRCTVCGQTGWGPAGDPPLDEMSIWQVKCSKPHSYACSCGRAFTTGTGLSSHLGKRRWKRDEAFLKIHRPVEGS